MKLKVKNASEVQDDHIKSKLLKHLQLIINKSDKNNTDLGF